RAVRVEGLLVRAAADMAHRSDPTSLDARALLPEPGRQPCLPEVGRLHHVIVDADDLGQFHTRSQKLTGRHIVDGRDGRSLCQEIVEPTCANDCEPPCGRRSWKLTT